MTPPEIALWLALRRNDAGLRFRRQHPAGPYILDFYCASAALVIEVDGEAHSRGDRPTRDAARDTWLADQELRILRYPAAEVLRDVEGIVRQILVVAAGLASTGRTSPPSAPSDRLRRPPPPGGGG